MPYDSDAQDYFDRVAASGTPLLTADKQPVSDFVAALKTASLWSKIFEWAPALGENLVASCVKLKYQSGDASSLMPVNMIEGDYVPALGWTGNGTDKHLSGGISPDSHGLTRDNLSVGVWRETPGVGNGIALGCSDQWIGHNYSSNFGGATTAQPWKMPERFGVVAANGSGTVQHYCQAQPTVNFTDSALTPATTSDATGSFDVLSFGGLYGFYESQCVGGYFVASALSPSEVATIRDAWETLKGKLIHNRTDGNTLVTFGDSITQGGAYPASLASALGMTLVNAGIAGTAVTWSGNNDDRMGRATFYARVCRYKPSRVTVMYGTNDIGFLVLTSSVAEYKQHLKETVLGISRLAGISLSAICIGMVYMSSVGLKNFLNTYSPIGGSGWTDAQARQLNIDYRDAVAEVADETGCLYADVYGAMETAGTEASNVDVHPGSPGNAVIKDAFLAALADASTITGITASPDTVTLYGGQTQEYSAGVEGTGDFSTDVTWSVNIGSFAGAIYTAPGGLASGAQTATITATSVQDNTKTGTATVTIPAHTAEGSGSGGRFHLGAEGLNA